MKSIMAYDIDSRLIERAAEKNDVTEAEIIEILCDYLNQAMEENNMKGVNV